MSIFFVYTYTKSVCPLNNNVLKRAQYQSAQYPKVKSWSAAQTEAQWVYVSSSYLVSLTG